MIRDQYTVDQFTKQYRYMIWPLVLSTFAPASWFVWFLLARRWALALSQCRAVLLYSIRLQLNALSALCQLWLSSALIVEAPREK
jgi:hypothetical protein